MIKTKLKGYSIIFYSFIAVILLVPTVQAPGTCQGEEQVGYGPGCTLPSHGNWGTPCTNYGALCGGCWGGPVQYGSRCVETICDPKQNQPCGNGGTLGCDGITCSIPCSSSQGQPCGNGGTLGCDGVTCSKPCDSKQNQPCGNGGTLGCDGVTCSKPCDPKQNQACGSCGGKIQCDGSCSISTPSKLGQSCGNCGTYDCKENCINEGPCAPNTIGTGTACGNCGIQKRTCQTNCQWGAYACTSEGECAIGTNALGAECGRCGFLQKTCQNNCYYGPETCQFEKNYCDKEKPISKYTDIRFCSTTNKWLVLIGSRDAVKNLTSNIPLKSDETEFECCGITQCWNGKSCVDNQDSIFSQPNHLGQYRCSGTNGAWRISTRRYSPDNSLSGHCLTETDCLLNPETNKCIPTNNFDNDHICTDGIWNLIDLDLSKSIVPVAHRQTRCGVRGFTWTGNYCCGEPEDGAEYYNDPIGCWNGHSVPSGYATELDYSIFFSNGKFRGCAMDSDNFITVNNDLTRILDDKNGGKLISNEAYCSKYHDVFCSYTEKWLPTAGRTPDILKEIPNTLQSKEYQKECCGQTQCWNGSGCVANQDSIFSQSNHRGQYRCSGSNGEWRISTRRYSADKSLSGHCLTETDCMVNPATNNCIPTNNFIGNDLCINGEWTTRSRALAIALLHINGNGPYSLYCDVPSKALGTGPIKYDTTTSSFIGPLLPTCLMNSGEKTIVGIGFDSMPTSDAMNLLFTNADCSSVSADGNFNSCIGSNVLFNKQFMSFIKGTRPLEVSSIPLSQTLEGSIPPPTLLDRLRNILSQITSKWSSLFSVSSTTKAFTGDPNYNNLIQTLSFDKLYMSKVGTGTNERSVFGYYQKVGSTHNAVIRYTNFADDVCVLVERYKAANTDIFPNKGPNGEDIAPGSSQIAGIGCFKESDNTYILLIQGRPSSNFNYERTEKAWEDFTLKLRVSS